MGENIGRLFEAGDEAGGSLGDSVGKVYKIETTGANGWPDGRYGMAGAEIAVGALGDEGGGRTLPMYKMGDMSTVPHSIGCGAGRAYIGISDDGSIGEGDEGSEGTDGRLPLYKKMAHTTE